jgi:hypothetical protein
MWPHRVDKNRFLFLCRENDTYPLLLLNIFIHLLAGGNTKGLNLAAVMFTTVQVPRLPLWPELLVSSRA